MSAKAKPTKHEAKARQLASFARCMFVMGACSGRHELMDKALESLEEIENLIEAPEASKKKHLMVEPGWRFGS